jgi:hypothetical protein
MVCMKHIRWTNAIIRSILIATIQWCFYNNIDKVNGGSHQTMSKKCHMVYILTLLGKTWCFPNLCLIRRSKTLCDWVIALSSKTTLSDYYMYIYDDNRMTNAKFMFLILKWPNLMWDLSSFRENLQRSMYGDATHDRQRNCLIGIIDWPVLRKACTS